MQTQFLRKAAFYLLLIGTLGSITAYVAGNAAGEGMEEGTLGKAMALHEQAATVSLWLVALTAIVYLAIFFLHYNKRWIRIVSIFLFAGVVAAIIRTGYLGGQLVYKHGAGVELALPDFNNPGEK
jgi:uncharacterized membrane protein